MSVRGLSSLEIDAIGEILNISIGASATAISTMLERRVDITIPSVQVSSYDDFEYPNMEPAICVEIGYASGLSGKNVMFLKREGVKAIVEILMHTEIPDEEFELDEMYLSAVCEVMNQMMGASATVLSDLLGKVVNIMTPVSHEIDTVIKFKDHYFVGGEDMVVVRFILNIEGVIESEFLNVMPITLAREMLDCIGFRDESAEGSYEEVAKAPAEPAPSSGGVMSQEEIEKLLSGGVGSTPAPAEPAPSSGGVMSQEEIEKLLAGGVAAEPVPPQMAPQQVPPQMGYPQYPYPYPPAGYPMAPPPGYEQYYEPQRSPKVVNVRADSNDEKKSHNGKREERPENIDMIMDVPLEISVEIGRTKKNVKEILEYSQGSLIILDKIAGEQVDIFVNGQCIAKGDVVVVDDSFGVKITEIIKKIN